MISFRPYPVMTLAALAALIVLVSLGNWQMRRLAWKEDLIAQVETRTERPPVPLEEALAEGMPAEIRFTPVTVTGRYDHEGEVHVFGQSLEGTPGYYIYTPLLREGDPAVIVNRGFVPAPLKDPAARAQGQAAGEVTITGLLRASRDRGAFQPRNNAGANEWYVADVDEMAAAMDLERAAPVFVDAGPAPNPSGWPLGGQTRVSFRNSHLAYALTWYGLAVTLLGVYIAVHIKAGRLAFRRSRK